MIQNPLDAIRVELWRVTLTSNYKFYFQIFIFCMMWSLGAFLENPDRKKLEVYLSKNTKLKMPKLPDGDSIFNYNVNVHNGKWFHWNSLVRLRIIFLNSKVWFKRLRLFKKSFFLF
jgi:hypothetical protein